jgi:hypothetical protein
VSVLAESVVGAVILGRLGLAAGGRARRILASQFLD